MCLNFGRAILGMTLVLCVTIVSLAQAQAAGPSVGPLSDEPRFFAAFSATANTRVVQRTSQGGRFERLVVAKYYRDSFGRVRIEYSPSSPSDSDARTAVVVVPNPYARTDRGFLVEDDHKLVEWTNFPILAGLFNTARAVAVATGLRRFSVFPAAEVRYSGNGLFEDLGSRMIGGVRADGIRFTTSLSKAVDERWESPDLGLVVRARFVDQERGWEIDYTLTDIQRKEPPQELFVMPAGYEYRHGENLLLESPEAELLRIQANKR